MIPMPLVGPATIQVDSATSSLIGSAGSAPLPVSTSAFHGNAHFIEHPPINSGSTGSATFALMVGGPACAETCRIARKAPMQWA